MVPQQTPIRIRLHELRLQPDPPIDCVQCCFIGENYLHLMGVHQVPPSPPSSGYFLGQSLDNSNFARVHGNEIERMVQEQCPNPTDCGPSPIRSMTRTVTAHELTHLFYVNDSCALHDCKSAWCGAGSTDFCPIDPSQYTKCFEAGATRQWCIIHELPENTNYFDLSACQLSTPYRRMECVDLLGVDTCPTPSSCNSTICPLTQDPSCSKDCSVRNSCHYLCYEQGLVWDCCTNPPPSCCSQLPGRIGIRTWTEPN